MQRGLLLLQFGSTMVKKVQEQPENGTEHKSNKATRFDAPAEVQANNKRTWPSNAVVYIGHLPHGFYQEQMKAYFTQYGEVLEVKVARSKITARSKGYGFVQFKYPQVAEIVSDTMNGYLLMGKVLISNTLSAGQKNPFNYSSSKKYQFINWKRLYAKQKNDPKTEEQTAHIIHGLLKNEEKRRQKFKSIGITYEFPGFAHYIPKQQPKTKQIKPVVRVDKKLDKNKVK